MGFFSSVTRDRRSRGNRHTALLWGLGPHLSAAEVYFIHFVRYYFLLNTVEAQTVE